MKQTTPAKSQRDWEGFFKRCDADRKKFDKLQAKINAEFSTKKVKTNDPNKETDDDTGD